MVLALLSWWLRCLYHDAVLGLRRWAREPEWPLLAVAVAFTASFLFHWLGYRLAIHRVGWSAPLFALTEWEGRTGWRKPLVFGISNAMVFVSLREAFAAQQLAPRRLASHLVAWSTALEVGIITLQAWRGVGSHFNTSTTLDASLYGAKLCGAALLGLGCFVAAAGFTLWPAPAVPAAKAVALRHGLWLLCIAVAVGVGQAIYGHHLREARPEEDASCLVASAGVAASPCYEIHGQAIVKLAHFLPLHLTEVLLLLAWATAHVDGVFRCPCSAHRCGRLLVLGWPWALADCARREPQEPISGSRLDIIRVSRNSPSSFRVCFSGTAPDPDRDAGREEARFRSVGRLGCKPCSGL
ncbi:unnamed protein product [Polarella glacialis]|uniref:Uncharacterized protein n=1 Tax=Polarella glacialis TaxID=89957 RepID=A0A813F2X0_POLGL|nr:unnamed protein product [Polarella glacialis]